LWLALRRYFPAARAASPPGFKNRVGKAISPSEAPAEPGVTGSAPDNARRGRALCAPEGFAMRWLPGGAAVSTRERGADLRKE